MTKDFMERTEKDWLDCLLMEMPKLIHQPIALKKQYPREFRRILQVVGNWMTVEKKLELYRKGKYQPIDVLSEELKAMKCDAVSEYEAPECDEALEQEKNERSKPASNTGLISVRKVESGFRMPEPNPRYATKYSEIFKAKPYLAATLPMGSWTGEKVTARKISGEVTRGGLEAQVRLNFDTKK